MERMQQMQSWKSRNHPITGTPDANLVSLLHPGPDCGPGDESHTCLSTVSSLKVTLVRQLIILSLIDLFGAYRAIQPSWGGLLRQVETILSEYQAPHNYYFSISNCIARHVMLVPKFYFELHMLRPRLGYPPRADSLGRWLPPKSIFCNERILPNGEHSIYYCNGESIRRLSEPPPENLREYKTFSIYYRLSEFLIVNYDASLHYIGDGRDGGNPNGIPEHHPERHEFRTDWRILSFEWNEVNYSSFATIGGSRQYLRARRNDQQWPNMLLPQCYHAPPNWNFPASQPLLGGLNGELPLILALVALSVQAQHLDWVMSNFQNGMWMIHQQPNGWSQERGFVVKVLYLDCETTDEHLGAYERGSYGNMFL